MRQTTRYEFEDTEKRREFPLSLCFCTPFLPPSCLLTLRFSCPFTRTTLSPPRHVLAGGYSRTPNARTAQPWNSVASPRSPRFIASPRPASPPSTGWPSVSMLFSTTPSCLHHHLHRLCSRPSQPTSTPVLPFLTFGWNPILGLFSLLGAHPVNASQAPIVGFPRPESPML